MTEEEQKIFFDYCKGTFYDNLFTVAICTGLRIGELASLRECDLDFDKKKIIFGLSLMVYSMEQRRIMTVIRTEDRQSY